MGGQVAGRGERIFRPDPKDGPRVSALPEEWYRLRRVKDGPCRVCGYRATSLHHLVPRSLGGDDVEQNLVPLCGSGTTGCHGLVEEGDPAARRGLRRSLKKDELAYVVRRKGRRFLDRYLPTR
jgi:5-methylcytosine-specific restriction endonuclease McrA